MSTCYIETLNKLSGEITDIMCKLVNLKIHLNVRLEEEEVVTDSDYELIEALLYDMLNGRVKAYRKLRDMKVIVDIEPDLLVCVEVELGLKNAEENCKLIYEMYNEMSEMFKAKFTK